MFKYRRGMQWSHDASFPFNAGFVSSQRIPIRHYPHRDPEQMARRYQLRAAMMKLKAHAGGHWKLDDWRQELVDASGASPASQGEMKSGLAGERGIDTGPLYYWEPAKPFTEMPLANHVPPWRTRLMQRVIHPLLLPILDRRRPRFDSSFQPEPIPAEIAANFYR
jgi:hypothetical protein